MVDEAADLLLAQALWAAEQADFYDNAYNGCDRSDDSDYDDGGRKRKRQQKKGRVRQARKSKAAGPGQGLGTAGTAAASLNASLTQQQPQQQQQQQQGQNTAGVAAQINHSSEDSDGPDDAEGDKQQQHQHQQQQEHQQEGHELSAAGRRKRKDVGQKRERGRPWDEAEEAAFLAGLEQHGRDWKAVAAAISSRDSRAVASHAQKHFIRLCLAGQPLPAKVAESGRGYTLSGRLLDPSSAAALAYGFKQEALARLTPEQLAIAMSGMQQQGHEDAAQDDAAAASNSGSKDQTRPAAAVAAAKRTKQCSAPGSIIPVKTEEQAAADQLAAALHVAPPVLAPREAAAAAAVSTSVAAAAAAAKVAGVCAGNVDESTGTSSSAAAGDVAARAGHHPDVTTTCSSGDLGTGGKPTTKAPSAAAEAAATAAAAAAAAAATAAAAEPDGLTEYARARPRREAAANKRLLQLAATSESLELVFCRDFIGPVGSGTPAAQPFSVEVELQVMLVMEFHAHLSSCEVIGLLGGSWDQQQRRLQVQAAFACRRAAGSDAATSVELDPAAEVEARAAMAAAGLRAVGWYHSHPTFAPHPSLKDMENQRNYQALTRTTEPGGITCEPFLGFILGPYDLAMPRPLTTITAFQVQQKGQELLPFNVKYGMVAATVLPNQLRSNTLRPLLASHKDDIGRTDFCSLWRPFTALCPGSGVPLGPPLSKLDKLMSALRWQSSHVADRDKLQEWLQSVQADIQEIWDLPALDKCTLQGQMQPSNAATGATAAEGPATGAKAAAGHEQQPQQQPGVLPHTHQHGEQGGREQEHGAPGSSAEGDGDVS